MKRNFLVLLILVLFSGVIFAQETDVNETEAEIVDSMHFKYYGVRYAFEENKKSLYVDVNYNEETPTMINIMYKIKINGKDYIVKRIGPRAFYGCRNITCITIPSSIEVIDSSAFRWCVNLSNIGVPQTVKRIGPDCFRNCTNLRNFNFPKDLTSVSSGAFRASGLMSVVLPEGIKAVGDFAFEGCKALDSISLPKSLNNIGKEAFSNCWALKTVVLYDQVRNVGVSAFQSCRSLKRVIIVKVVDSRIKTLISESAFAECKMLQSVVCYTSRTGKVRDVLFNENAFADCKFNLENVEYRGTQAVDPNAAKRKKGDPEFEEEEIIVDADNAERLRTSATVKRARKNIGVRKNKNSKKKR